MEIIGAFEKLKGSFFEVLYRRYVPRPGHNQTIRVIAHRLCRLNWRICNKESASAVFRLDYSQSIQIRPQRLGNADGAVSLLVVLDQS
jgi:hypothetical protein